MVVREDMAETLRHNPRLSELITWRRGDSLVDLSRRLKATPWSHQLDLHGSLRSHALRRLVGGRWTSYTKHRLRRALLVQSGGTRGGDLGHVAERYFAAAAGLDVVPDGLPPEFFTTREAEREADAFLAEHGLGEKRTLLAFAPGAAHFTKRWPTERWSALLRRIRGNADVVILGGPGDQDLASGIARAGEGRAVSAAGRLHAHRDGSTAQAVASPGVVRYRGPPPGHGGRDAGGGPLRPHGGAIRLLPLSRPGHGAPARPPLPPLQHARGAHVPTRAPPLHDGAQP